MNTFKEPNVVEKVIGLPIFNNNLENSDLVQLDSDSKPITDNPLVPGVKRFGKVSFWLISLMVVGGILFFLPTILKTISLLILIGIGLGLITFGSILSVIFCGIYFAYLKILN